MRVTDCTGESLPNIHTMCIYMYPSTKDPRSTQNFALPNMVGGSKPYRVPARAVIPDPDGVHAIL